MAEVNYESLVAELIKPLVTHPEDVKTTSSVDGDKVLVKALVNQNDLGRVIGKKGRVASAIRTIAHAAAIRQKQELDIEFSANE
jgi:UPF0109 protein LMOf2365_1823